MDGHATSDSSTEKRSIRRVAARALDYGLPRRKPGIALSLAALNCVLEHAADDMTISVEAGITLAELNRQLAVKGQWLPIDAPEADIASVGGIIASNAFGPRRHGCMGRLATT